MAQGTVWARDISHLDGQVVVDIRLERSRVPALVCATWSDHGMHVDSHLLVSQIPG